MNIKEVMQYTDLKKECSEMRARVSSLKRDIERIDGKLDRMTRKKDVVRDKVYGGYGGTQGFVIEGFPMKEYEREKSLLLAKKAVYNARVADLEEFESKLDLMVREIECFIRGIGDSHIRRIITYRFVDGLSWEKVAIRIGGGNSEDTVRMQFKRFLKKRSDCSELNDKIGTE